MKSWIMTLYLNTTEYSFAVRVNSHLVSNANGCSRGSIPPPKIGHSRAMSLIDYTFVLPWMLKDNQQPTTCIRATSSDWYNPEELGRLTE